MTEDTVQPKGRLITAGEATAMLSKVPDETPLYVELASWGNGAIQDMKMGLVAIEVSTAFSQGEGMLGTAVFTTEDDVHA